VIELPNAPFNLIQKIGPRVPPGSLRRGWSGHRTWGQMAVTANLQRHFASGGEPISCMIAIMVRGRRRRPTSATVVGRRGGNAAPMVSSSRVATPRSPPEAHVVGTCVGIVAKDGFLPRSVCAGGDRNSGAGRVGGFAGAYFLLKNMYGDT
jgi:hypothetical protein